MTRGETKFSGGGVKFIGIQHVTIAKENEKIPLSMAAGIEAGLRRLGQYTAAAEALGEEMAREDGVAAAADIIEACLR